MNSPELLVHLEHCRREGFWARDWHRWKMDDGEMMQAAIREGLTADRADFALHAGNSCYGFGLEPGLASSQENVHSEVVHISALSEIVTAAVRKPKDPAWKIAQPVNLKNGPAWNSGAYLNAAGTRLRRIVLVSNWSEERHYHEARSWASLGESCAYGLPMQQAVIILGPRRDGKRHGFFSKAVRHPVSKQIRFRKRATFGEFKETWTTVWREDFSDITTEHWLEVMLEDGVLKDSCFMVTVEVPEKLQRERILDIAKRRLEQVERMKEAPEQCLSVCDWPVPCTFRSPCHKNDAPSGRYGFVKINDVDGLSSRKELPATLEQLSQGRPR